MSDSTKTEKTAKPSYKVETVSGAEALKLVGNAKAFGGGSVNDNQLEKLPIGVTLEGTIVGFGHRPYDGKLFLKMVCQSVPCRVGMTEQFKPEFERLCSLDDAGLKGESVKFQHYVGLVGAEGQKVLAHWAFTV